MARNVIDLDEARRRRALVPDPMTGRPLRPETAAVHVSGPPAGLIPPA